MRRNAAVSFARALLMPAEDFDATAWRPDVEVGERFETRWGLCAAKVVHRYPVQIRDRAWVLLEPVARILKPSSLSGHVRTQLEAAPATVV